jgi:hypothetical protein
MWRNIGKNIKNLFNVRPPKNLDLADGFTVLKKENKIEIV